ncbi:protamine-2 (modular protein) [Mesorhizobium retamae]|uniref:Protamine-2 (Modular protein) n=1 Tax=Mesorhizobium retamae TaxID=2912854 RepID=A0ABS9QIJ8_9HYPH|nr:protamine-2 (modular protein) [Mesorhizobium sp. IRAMC:0171]MCG7507279.1 protamine-2 (modular protein) [Mesorhizobium sp. IRAMC:0171]
MDRRLFLTGILGVAGAAVVATAMRPAQAVAGVPAARGGILDELEQSHAEAAVLDDENDADAELVYHRPWHRPGRRPWRRPRWRRVCRRVWRRGRWRVRCWRERVWR